MRSVADAAQLLYEQGWMAFAVATPVAGLVLALLHLSRIGMPRGVRMSLLGALDGLGAG